MKKILLFMLLLVNLQLTTDDGSLSIGFGEVAAQSYWEEELPEVVVTGNAYEECNLCHHTYPKNEMEQHQEYECPERSLTCEKCNISYKYSESHTCDAKEGNCVFCSKPVDQCTCNGPEIQGSGSGSSGGRPSGGYGGGGKPTGSAQNSSSTKEGDSQDQKYKTVETAELENAIKKAIEYTKNKYGKTKACNIAVQKAAQEALGYIPEELQGKANTIANNLSKSKNWTRLTINEAIKEVRNKGFIVAVWKNGSGGSGHVVLGNPNTASNGPFCVMDGGPSPVGKNECQSWRSSFGKDKRPHVVFYILNK